MTTSTDVVPRLTDELASMTRMFHAACADLGAINEALGLDPDDGGAEPIINAINDLKSRILSPASEVQADHIADERKMSLAARDVLAERERQMSAEGWTPEHDDEHTWGEIADAAACYAHHAGMRASGALSGNLAGGFTFWPWDKEWWKPSTPRRDLVKAGALILAEIERIDRAASSAGDQKVES